MKCEAVPLAGGVAIVCSRGRRAKPCSVPGCGRSSVALCDFPLTGAKAGKTCDRALCAQHRTSVGADLDHCPAHAELKKGGARASPDPAGEANAASNEPAVSPSVGTLCPAVHPTWGPCSRELGHAGAHVPKPPPHACHATGCDVEVSPRMLMCRRHWAMVPRALQRMVWGAYVPGQEIRKDPTSAYMRVARDAIAVVAAKEGR